LTLESFAIDDAGWARGARRVPSPNFDQRSGDSTVDLLVVHSISLPPGEFGGNALCELFTNTLDSSSHVSFAGLEALRVSSHFLIRRTGEVIQFVSCLDRAWHAGVSSFEGRTSCNDFSVGIELEGTDADIFTAEQYEALVVITRQMLVRFPIFAAAAHSEIAPDRKTDPGPGFDWSQLLNPLPSLRRMRALSAG
jgi:N-acetyl-anhydromuramoyl-L-alanine amidase